MKSLRRRLLYELPKSPTADNDVEIAKTSGRKQFNEMIKWPKRNRSCRAVIVEKTDRIYRNFRDLVTVEDLDIETHLVKDNQIVSKDSKSQAKFIHGINLVVAKNYSDNLCEEVNKGMRERRRRADIQVTLPLATGTTRASGRSRLIPLILSWLSD